MDDIQKYIMSVLDAILPPSPFRAISNSSVSDFLGGFNWILPIDEIIAILQLWVVAVAAFYVISIILRWIKAIE